MTGYMFHHARRHLQYCMLRVFVSDFGTTLLSHDYRLTPLVLFDHCPWNYPIFIRLETIPFDADRHPGHDTDAIYHSYLEKAILSQGSLTLVPVV